MATCNAAGFHAWTRYKQGLACRNLSPALSLVLIAAPMMRGHGLYFGSSRIMSGIGMSDSLKRLIR